MFWTPRPTLETSSEPSLRRPDAPVRCWRCARLRCGLRRAPPSSGAAARRRCRQQEPRRPDRRVRVLWPWSIVLPRCGAARGESRPQASGSSGRSWWCDVCGVRPAAHAGVERVDRGDLARARARSRRRRSSRRCARRAPISGWREKPCCRCQRSMICAGSCRAARQGRSRPDATAGSALFGIVGEVAHDAADRRPGLRQRCRAARGSRAVRLA